MRAHLSWILLLAPLLVHAAEPYAMKAKPTAGIPMTAQVFNMDQINEGADPGQQGTQFDALGHFGALRQPWDGKSALPAEQAAYYGGFAQHDVKPTPDSSLARL